MKVLQNYLNNFPGHKQTARDVIQLLNDGHYVVVTANAWWVKDGQLQRTCTADEMMILDQLEAEGKVTTNVKSFMY